jgi:hypothetical protein
MCFLKARIKTLLIGVLLLSVLLPCSVYAATQEAGTLPLATSMIISPAESTIFVGQSQAYTAEAYDAEGNPVGDVTGLTTFDIDDEAGGSWAANTYTSDVAGEWTVTGTYEGLIDNATLTVKPWEVVETIPEGKTDYQVALPEANTTITVDTTDNVIISLGKYDSNPHPEAPSPATMLPRYIDIEVSDPDAIDWPILVKQFYIDAEIVGLEEASLRMYYFKTADNAWLICSDTDVNMGENYVWAKMTELEVSGSPVGIGATSAIPPTPMYKFEIDYAKLEFSKKPDNDSAYVLGELKLDLVNGDGVDISELVTVTVGSVSETITMVERGRKGEKWEYKRLRGYEGIIREMTINWKNGEFDIRIDKADLSGVTNPATISIQIGDDIGKETILMREKKHYWEYAARRQWRWWEWWR